MAKKYKSRTSRHRHRRSKRGGRALLDSSPYPSSSSGSWNTSAPPGTAASAAAGFKSFLSGFAQGSPAQNAAALNEFALKGQGQAGGGRSKRRGRGRKNTGKSSKKISPKSFGDSNTREQQMAQGMTQAQAQAQAAAMQQAQQQQLAQTQSGGMFASFGALLKEALVPLGLLAAQQTYAKSYGKHTRKNRK
jgi:hypothetical protein